MAGATLIHPFPVVLDALVTAAVALVAGGSPMTAVRLAISMFGLQAAIGALNDVVDASTDAGLKPGKPIPAGVVRPTTGLAVAIASGVAGLALAVPSGPATGVLALVVLGIGALYDLRLKGTALSWLPFAVGIPLLPAFGWLGATGTLPGWFTVLLPTAGIAGAALAIANAIVDVERDVAAGRSSVAAALGRSRAWGVHLALHVAVLVLAGGSALAFGQGVHRVVALVLPPLVVIGAGAALARSRDPDRRERGWQLEALGIAVLAGTWLVLGIPR